MPVGNAMPYLRESVASILGQTHPDFDFLIVDDATTDGSAEYLRDQAARDSRIRLERLQRPLGVVGAGNRAAELATTPLLARMDADDISAPRRLEIQLDTLERNPDAVLVGAMSDGIDAAGHRVRGRDRWRLLRRSMFPPFPHGSMMVRREAFESLGGYREACGGWHDTELILRMSSIGRVLVLPDTLYHFRYHTGSVTHSRSQARACAEAATMYRCMDAIREGHSHDALLPTPGTDVDVPPEVAAWTARYRDALLLWSGSPPASGRPAGGPIRTRARGAWHRRHPSSLRGLLRVMIAARDSATGLVIRDGRVREWRDA